MHRAQEALAKLADRISASRDILVFTGAGISTAAGIPDFRGPDGLYARTMDLYDLPFPEAVFEIGWFVEHPEPFYKFSADLFAVHPEPTLAHRALTKLETPERRVRIVTQNIDMLHENAGSLDVLACHGSYASGHCLACGRVLPFSEYEENLLAGTVARCLACSGLIKPDIVFFGENLPAPFYDLLHDLPPVDFVLVLGTSLTVQPAASLPLALLRRGMLGALINLSSTPYDEAFEIVIRGQLETILPDLVRLVHPE